MFSKILGKEIAEDSPAPGYFFYGEEVYLADEFVGELRRAVVAPDAQDFQLTLYYLDETKWADIIDTARTVPFLFASWRILVVKAPEKKSNGDGNGEKESKLLSAIEEKILKAYFASAAPRTVIVVILPGRIRKSHALVKLFSALPAVTVKEMKPLRPDQIESWIVEKAASLGKAFSMEGRRRLAEIVGSDLRRLDNEIEKLTVYVDERKTIEAADVDQATAWLREYADYELDDNLAAGDFRKCLIVLDNLFKSGERPEHVLGRLFGFYKKILLARIWLEEKSRDRKEIFKTFNPNISETFRSLYQRKFTEFFALVDRFSRADLRRILDGLAEVDTRIKSSDVPAQTAFEVFLFDYCRMRKKAAVTSKAWA